MPTLIQKKKQNKTRKKGSFFDADKVIKKILKNRSSTGNVTVNSSGSDLGNKLKFQANGTSNV